MDHQTRSSCRGQSSARSPSACGQIPEIDEYIADGGEDFDDLLVLDAQPAKETVSGVTAELLAGRTRRQPESRDELADKHGARRQGAARAGAFDATFLRHDVGEPADDRLIRGLCLVTRYFLSGTGAGIGVGVGVDVDAFPPAGAGTPRDDQYAALFEFNWFARLLAFALPLW